MYDQKESYLPQSIVNENCRDVGNFMIKKYLVFLQKPITEKLDVINITAILEQLETTYNNKDIGKTTALALCLGDNDYIPKFYGISQSSVFKYILSDESLRSALLTERNTINCDIFLDVIKVLYCPKHKDHRSLTYISYNCFYPACCFANGVP